MKLLINSSTLSGTGVTQVAVSFIKECILITGNEYHVLLSKTVSSQIDKSEFPPNFFFYDIEFHPLYGYRGCRMRLKLRKLEKIIKPDCVFSVFGPSWWTPNAPHLMGYAYPHYVYPDSPFFKNINLLEKLKINFFKKIHLFFLRKNGNYLVSETEDVTNRLVNLLNFKTDNVFTVTNTYNDYFNNFTKKNIANLPIKHEGDFWFLSLCSLASHKNLTILNEVIPILRDKIDKNLKFVMTIDQDLFEKKFNKKNRELIINLGRIDVSSCPHLYNVCDALFLPTTLECLSANYPESMKMGVPILTSNLSFATSICGNAALYFDPYNPLQIASKIQQIVNDSKIRNELIVNGNTQLNVFLTPQERARKYLEICLKIINNENLYVE